MAITHDNYESQIIKRIQTFFEQIFPTVVTESILIEYVVYIFKIKSTRLLKNVPWTYFYETSSIVCTDDIICVFNKFAEYIYQIDIKSLEIKNIPLNMELRTYCDMKAYGFAKFGNQIGLLESVTEQNSINTFDKEKICLATFKKFYDPKILQMLKWCEIIMSQCKKYMIVHSHFYDYNGCISKYHLSSETKRIGKYIYEPSDDEHGKKYELMTSIHEPCIKVLLFGNLPTKRMIVITEEHIRLHDFYNFELLHEIQTSRKKRIKGACANNNFIFLLREIHPEAIKRMNIKDEIGLCVDVLGAECIKNDFLKINKPSNTIYINKTSKHHPIKYHISASETCLVVSNDDYQLNIFELAVAN